MTLRNKLEYAEMRILSCGCDIVQTDTTKIVFLYKDQTVLYYYKKEWATGKSIEDGRGLNFLINQLK